MHNRCQRILRLSAAALTVNPMTSFTVRTPVDLLALVPYVIGFHPEDSVVLLTFSEDRPLGPPGRAETFHARIDLPVTEHEQRQVARLLRDVVARHRATLIGLLLYTDDVEAAQSFAGLMVGGLVRDCVDIIDVVRVEQDRFYPVDDPEDPGTPYDLRGHQFTAEAVLDGRVVHENRVALADSLVGTDPEDALLVAEAASNLVDHLIEVGHRGAVLAPELAGHARWLQERIRMHLDDRARLDPGDAGRLLVLTSFDALREVAWAEMTRTNATVHVELWRDLVRRAPHDLRSGAAGLLAFAAWLAGDGALAWCALDRCFEGDPDDRLGQHVAALVESATPPSVWAPMQTSSLRIFGATGRRTG
ncbi:MAG: hypothetical protein JWQ32_2421 [Marmoricola sp.]|nr:hypothetical protein [Marmoricola sp.]